MKTLIVIDRETGEERRIPEGDPFFGMEMETARLVRWGCNSSALLDSGQDVVTFGYIRRLVDS